MTQSYGNTKYRLFCFYNVVVALLCNKLFACQHQSQDMDGCSFISPIYTLTTY